MRRDDQSGEDAVYSRANEVIPRGGNRRIHGLVLACLVLTAGSAASSAPPDKSGVKPGVLSLPSGAGSIEGLGESFEPQLNTGGSSYGVTIAPAPGRAGLAPSVRLSYNSYTGNGMCGIGWSLSFMSLQRQTDKGFPEYNAGDTFVFAGEELVPLNNAGQDWRCENERGFQRLRRIDSDGDGSPDAWEVTERNGTRHTLGRFRGQNNRWSVVENPEKSSLQPFDRSYRWMVDSTTDLHGNHIDYEYLKGDGVLYPSRITYGHLAGNSQEILFEYEARPDVFDDHRPAFPSRLDRRLKRIEVRSRGNLVRAYNLSYAYEPGDLTPELAALQSTYLDLGVTLLKRVVQLDRSGSDANYLPPLIFTYSGLDLTKAELRGLASPPELDLAEPNGRVQLADLDGDALPDLFATTAEGAGKVQRVCLSRGESRASGEPKLMFAPSKQILGSSPVDLAEANTVVHDPKGKGLIDISSLVDDGPNKRLETFGNRARLDLVDENRLGFSLENFDATVLENPPDWVTYSNAGTRQLDVNFDKRGDFVNLEPSFGAMKVNTFYIGRSGRWLTSEAMLPPSYSLDNTFDGPDGQPNPCVHLADMNGDRLLDLICLAPIPSPNGQRIRISYWALSGLGRYAEERAIPTQEPDTFEIGHADLRDIYVDDITGDGLADVMVLDGSGPEAVLTLRVNIAGQRWSQPYVKAGLPRYAPRDPDSPTVFRMVDLNANGSLDLLFRNTSPQSSWIYVELLPHGTPSLVTGVDNSLGKRMSIVYGSAAEDEQWARESGHPWRTFAPLPLQVVRQIRISNGLDLNGDGREDAAVAEFRYRDPFYDGIEREFRGFAFAQRVDYGDDFLFEPLTGLMKPSAGWDTTTTPTGQRSGPSLVTRYRFHTGAADQQDNDDYGGNTPSERHIDEFTEIGGREEEVLKGLQWVEEIVDPVVLHSALDGAFDAGCEAAAKAATLDARKKMTPDAYVYARSSKDWTVRRLYRPSEPLPYLADQNANGVLEDYRNAPAPPIPAGRFASQGVTVLNGSGRSVSFAFLSTNQTEILEANGLLSSALGYPIVPAQQTLSTFDYDDYGNQTLMRDFGLLNDTSDDERFVTTTYAHGGNALPLWIIDKPDTISTTDEQGGFVARKVFHYDGEPFVGTQGHIQDRALLHRALEHIDPTRTIQSSRSMYDAFGNVVETRDPVGNVRRITYDPVFATYPVSETMVVGGGSPDLSLEAEYDHGFGVVTQSKDFNGRVTVYEYDSFARLVKKVRPGDSSAFPSATYEYQPCDPIRGRAFKYDASGGLTIASVPAGSVSRVVTRQREVAGQPGEFITATYSDGTGKSLASIEEGDLPGTWVVTQATSFNLRGQSQAEWLPYRIAAAETPQFPVIWPSGRPPASDNVNPSVVSTEFFYDPRGRIIRTVNPPEEWDGPRRETASQHVPFQRLRFDEEDLRDGSPHAGTPHIEVSDGLGRVVAVEEVVKTTSDGQPGPLTAWRTEYSWDLNDRLVRIKDSQGNVKTMSYDGLQRMVSVSDPDRGSFAVTYDDASNIIQTTDNKGQTIAYTYDGVNRIKAEDYRDGSPKLHEVEYFYDEPQPDLDLGDGTTETATNTKGQIASVRDESGEIHFSYDTRARLERETRQIADGASSRPVSYTTRFSYDSADRLLSIMYPDGDAVTNSYSSRNLLARIHGGRIGDIIESILYRPSGQFETIRLGNNVTTAYAYDPRLRLTRLETSGGQGRRFMDYQYAFDAVSNIESIDDQRTLTGEPDAANRFNRQHFAYDNLYRLTRVAYPSLDSALPREIRYHYDPIGNLLGQASDITHLDRGQPVADLGSMAYGGAAGTSNRSGRLPDDPPGPHALTSITPSSGDPPPRSYAYDANGNVTADGSRQYSWDFKDRLVAVEDSTMRAEYVYDYKDRRVIKRVAHKTSTTSTSSPLTTYYVGKYFEVREHDQPVKYVYNQGARVARITGSLSDNTRIQRFTVRPGWNLCSIAVAAPDALRQITRSGVVNAQTVLHWNPQASSWRAVAADDALPAGAILWLQALTNGTLVLKGTYADPTNHVAAAGGAFCPGPGLEAWNVRSALAGQTSAAAWRFDPPSQLWQMHTLPHPDFGSNLFELLSPGSALFIASEAPSELEAPESALRIRYYHPDHLGSSSIITDAAGELVEETAFYPFGEPRVEYRPRGLDEPYKFAQKERDRETGLHYFSKRYLAANLSRFISVDPKYSAPGFLSPDELSAFISEPQDNNLYAFARNNPLRYADPTGLGVFDFIEDNLWIPFYHDLDDLDVGKTVRVTIAAAEVVGGVASCVESFGAGCAVAANGIDDLQAEFRDGRTLKAASVSFVTGSKKAGDYADIGISIALGGGHGFSKASRAQKAGKEADTAVGVVVGTMNSTKLEMVKGVSKSGRDDDAVSWATLASDSSTSSSTSAGSTPGAEDEPLACFAEEPVCYGDTEE
jgi:RHS repeat-associated protein